MNETLENIHNIFYPNSICIVGASSKEKSIGYEILRSIKQFGYTGKIFPVNPKSETILNFKCFKSITEIDEKIDLAIIVVAKKFVEESIDQLINNNIKSIILITAGFGETGEEGKILEENILKKIQKNNIRLVGPNCMGVINTLNEIKLNATFVAEEPQKGRIGFLSQSGALGAAVLNSLRETQIKFAHFISVGNKIDITENDILEFWLKDKNINVLTFYLESLENGYEFITKLKNSNFSKPVIILKAGKTKSGMKAASSHTGALSNNDKIINSLFKQFGIIRAETISEMFNTAKGFENFPIPKGNRIAIVTNAGGPAILAVDKLEERKLFLAELSENTQSKLKEIVHPEGSVSNPIDLLPGGTDEIYKKVNEIILADENVDAVVSIFVEPVMVNALEVIEAVNSIKSDKPIYQVCMPLPEFWQKYYVESKTKTPIFKNPEDPAEIISNILLYESKKNLKYNFIEKLLTKKNSQENFLSQAKIEKICLKYNLPIIQQNIFSENELLENDELKYPLVLKGIHPSAIHKSELDAVKLNLKNELELAKSVEEIKASFLEKKLEIKEFLIQPFIKPKFEILIGGFRDNSFGPTIMFGTGGKYVEVWEDIEIRSAILSDKDIEEMISNTKIGKLLYGVRGDLKADIYELKKIIKSVAKIMLENNEIVEIDVNPLIFSEEGNYHAVDIRIKTNS